MKKIPSILILHNKIETNEVEEIKTVDITVEDGICFYKIDDKKILCDSDGYVYSINSLGKKIQKQTLMFNPTTLMYSDGTPCDKDGYVYAVDEDGYKYKLYKPIKINQCDKTKVTFSIELDGEKSPSYFLTNVDENISYVRKWDLLEIFLTRNNSQNARDLTFTINHNIDAKIKQKVTIRQSGDNCEISFIKKEKYYTEYIEDSTILYKINEDDEEGFKYSDIMNITSSKDKNGNITYTPPINFKKRENFPLNTEWDNTFVSHLIINQKPEGEKEYYVLDFNIIGNLRKMFVKNIEQYILFSKQDNVKMYDNYGQIYILDENNTGEITETKSEKFKIDRYRLYTGVRSKYTNEEDLTVPEKNFFKNYYIEDIINDAINKIVITYNNEEYHYQDDNENILPSINTIFNSVSDEQIKNYKLQRVLRDYEENGGFPVYVDENIDNYNRRIFYDKLGDAVTIEIVKTEAIDEKQLSNIYSYETNYLQKSVKYIEQVEYDNGLNLTCSSIDNNKNRLIIENYGRLFLEGINSFYKIILAHQNDFSKTVEVYIKYNDTPLDNDKKSSSQQSQMYSLRNVNRVFKTDRLETVLIPHTNGIHKIYIKRSYTDIVNVKLEKCDWLSYDIVNDYIYITYKDNSFNYERNCNITIMLNGEKYKDFTLIQSPYVNYKIDVEYQNYILKYNEESFKVKINVYGGNKKIFIDDTNLPYKYKLELYFESVYFNTYYLIIYPKYNSLHKYILSNVIIIHEDDNNINKNLEFKQGLNLDTIEYTVLCDNVIILQPYTTKYLLEVETYPLKNSPIYCECNASWINYQIKENKIYLKIKQNTNKQKSTLLKITNKDFPFKQKFVKIIQRGVKK